MYLAPKRPVTGTNVAASPAMARAWPVTRAVTDSVVFGLISRMRKLLAFQAGPLRPLHLGRHRRQNRIDVAAGLQTEDGAAVVQQVEFHIASAPDQLLLAVFRAPRRIEVAPDDFGIDFQQGAADLLRKREVGVPVAAVVPVVEDAADAARFLAVRQVEIFVAPC